MNKVCNIDTKGIENILDNFNEGNRKTAIFNSLVKGGKELVEETKRELVKALPNAARGERYGTPMTKGVKMKKDKDYDEVKIHIMGDYRLKFFEMGTDERYLKKPLPHKETSRYKYKSGSNNTGGTPHRGRIKAKHFFQKAREDGRITDEVMNNLIKEINKLLK